MSIKTEKMDGFEQENYQTNESYANNNGDNYQQTEESLTARSRSRSPIRSRSSRSRSRSPSNRERVRRINLISKRVIISNVPYEMKWQDIKDIFRKEVGEVAYVEMWENPDGKSRGSGIIEFKDKDTARKAIENMHRYKMKDRNIVVREERESDRRQMAAGMMGGRSGNQSSGMGGNVGNMGGVSQQILNQLGIEGPVSNTLFVSNLDYKVTWKKLKDVFKLAGNVQRAEIKQDKEGKSRGIGIVIFDTAVEAVQAISMFNNQVLFERQMRVKMDSPPGSDRGMMKSNVQLPSGLKSIGQPLQNFNQMSSSNSGYGMGGGNMGMSSGGMGMGGGGMGGGSMGSMGGMGSNMDNMAMGMNNMSSGMGMMGNSSMSSGMGSGMGMSSGMGGMGGSGMGMGSGMSGSGGMGSGMGSGMGMSGGMGDNYGSGMGNSGYGSGSGMGSGMGDGMRGMDSGGIGGGAYSTGIMSSGMGSSGMGGGSGYMNSYSSDGRSRDVGRNMGTRPDNCTVVVKNLPWAVNWQTLRDKFKSVADVKYAEIKTENGKSQGWGLVRFGSADDAQRAISAMNRSRIDGREVDVKLYR